jgi:hypothetical protein
MSRIDDADLAEGLGNAGHEHVRRDFLVPRLARDDLSAYATLLGADTPRAAA